MINKIIIFTDGASSGNPGPGGYGAIIVEGNNVVEVGGGETKTTNNRMEILAAIESIKKTGVGMKIEIYTDSSYLLNGITKWIFGWIKNNWKTLDKKDVLNKDLWQKLFDLTEDREIKWNKVKGHASNAGNNRADEIATAFAQGEKINLFKGDRRNYKIDLSAPKKEDLDENSDRDRKQTKAFSYLSLVDGKIQRHSTWADCEKRVKGVAGAKFRKAISAADEKEIIKSWGL